MRTALIRRASIGLSCTLLGLPGWAADAPAATAERNYQQERAACMAGQSPQARETCLKEAGAAYDEARRGALGSATAGELERNATLRCDAQPPADRPACMQRMLGAGQGSVGGGGLIRETETPVK